MMLEDISTDHGGKQHAQGNGCRARPLDGGSQMLWGQGLVRIDEELLALGLWLVAHGEKRRIVDGGHTAPGGRMPFAFPAHEKVTVKEAKKTKVS